MDFYRERATERATAATIRALRARLRDTYTEVRQSFLATNIAQESVERARDALKSSTGLVEKGALRSLEAELSERLRIASYDLERSRERAERIRSTLWRQEAYFAQSQLLAIIQSGRFKLAPLSFAMGMAGLPRVSARISHERCSSIVRHVTPGLEFTKFQAVEAVFSRRISTVTEGIEKMQMYLCVPERAKNIAIKQLKKDWYFLRAATLSKLGRLEGSRISIPYLIFADYQRRTGTVSHADLVLAAEGQL